MKTKTYHDSTSIQKDIALSFDFSEYVAKNENIFKGLPRNPCIIVVDPKDRGFNEKKLLLAKKLRTVKNATLQKGRVPNGY